MSSQDLLSGSDDDIIGSATSIEDIISALAKHGCTNLTSTINPVACGIFPIAGGGFCDVYRGELHDSTRIAIKCLRVYDGPGADSERRKIFKHAARELYHWSRLQHPNVLPLLGFASFRGHMSMISEWMDNGSVMSFLMRNPNANRIHLCIDICMGLAHIHMNETVHGDLKAANVIVSPRNVAMITDFGSAWLKDSTLQFSNTTKLAFSVRWAAPEILLEDHGSRGSKGADVYAYGMTALEVLTGEVPFDGIDELRVLLRVANESLHPPRPDINLDDNLWELIKSCWTRNPAERPSITSVRDRLQVLNSDYNIESQEHRDTPRPSSAGGVDADSIPPRPARTTPTTDPYANAQPGTVAYAKSEGPDGIATYTPVVARETWYQTPNGLVRGIKWVTATSREALAAGIPAGPVSLKTTVSQTAGMMPPTTSSTRAPPGEYTPANEPPISVNNAGTPSNETEVDGSTSSIMSVGDRSQVLNSEYDTESQEHGGTPRPSSAGGVDADSIPLRPTWTTPTTDPYANAQPGTVAYVKSEGPDGIATYTPVVAQETWYQTPNGLVRGIKWVTATPREALAAEIPAGPVSQTAGMMPPGEYTPANEPPISVNNAGTPSSTSPDPLNRPNIPSNETGADRSTPILTRDSLTLLPPKLTAQILSYLPLSALLAATRVSRAWHQMIDQDITLWQALLKASGTWFGGPPELAYLSRILAIRNRNPSLLAGRPQPHPFKLLYRRREQTRRNWLQNQPRRLTLPAHGSNVITCLIFSRNRIISASDDRQIHVYSVTTGEWLLRLEGHEGGIWGLAVSPISLAAPHAAGSLVSVSADCTVRIWDLETGRCMHVFGGHTSAVICVVIIKPTWIDVNGHQEKWPKHTLIATGSRDHTLRVWKLPKQGDPEYHYGGMNYPPEVDANHNPYHVGLLSGHTHAVRALAAHGRTLISGSYDTTVRVWDIITGECKWTLDGHSQKVYGVVLDPQRNQVMSGSMDGTVRIWSLATGQALHTLTGHPSLIGQLGLSPTHLVSAAVDSTLHITLRIWDPKTGALQHTLSDHTGATICFQHDEFKVLSGSDGTLKMWDIQEGRAVCDLLTGVTDVWRVVFEGRWCVAATDRQGYTYLDLWDFGGEDSENEFEAEEGNWMEASEDENEMDAPRRPSRADKVVDTWNSYELRWSALSAASATQPITFRDIPWPLTRIPTGPESITPQAVGAFILSPLHSQDKSRKERLRIAMLRWHSDKFEGRWMARIDEGERPRVMEAVGAVHCALIELRANPNPNLY